MAQAPAQNPLAHVSGREVWSLTWPQFLMMFFQFLVGFTDVYVAGFISAEVQAALGMVTQCMFFLMIIAIALANGSIAAMSQSMGAGLQKRADRYIGLVMNLGAGFCVLTLVLGYLFRRELFSVLQVPEAILPLSERLWIFFLAVIPPNYLAVFSGAVFRSHKNVWIPLASSIVVCISNAFFDFGLGLGRFGLPNLGAEGLALATFCSTTAGAAFNTWMLVRQGRLGRQSFAPLCWQKKALPYLVKVAAPAGGMQFVWQLGYLALFAVAASLPVDSVNALAGMNVGMRIESILFLPGMAFSMTGSILVGHCLGAGQKEEAKRIGLLIIGVGSLAMTCVAALMWPWVWEIAAKMAQEPAVQPYVVSYLRYNLVATPFTICSMVLGGIMTGAGATVYTLIVYGGATWLIRLPLAWLLGHILWRDASGVFCAQLVSQVIQSLIMLYLYRHSEWTRFAMRAKKHGK